MESQVLSNGVKMGFKRSIWFQCGENRDHGTRKQEGDQWWLRNWMWNMRREGSVWHKNLEEWSCPLVMGQTGGGADLWRLGVIKSFSF